jgi:hypothetical protein
MASGKFTRAIPPKEGDPKAAPDRSRRLAVGNVFVRRLQLGTRPAPETPKGTQSEGAI